MVTPRRMEAVHALCTLLQDVISSKSPKHQYEELVQKGTYYSVLSIDVYIEENCAYFKEILNTNGFTE